MSDFCHLHVHSEYSLLDGLGRTSQLAQEAARLGQPALALTDHGVMHGAIEFFRNCKKNDIKPIIGVEAYMTHDGRKMHQRSSAKDKIRHHLLLLAQNMTGYKNLLKLCSQAQMNGYYYRPRVDADFLAAHSEGLICTTGCMAAEIPWFLNNEDRPAQPEKAQERLEWYLEVFGRDRFFIELQEHSIPELTRINKTLFEWAKQYRLEMIVTNDVHYVTAEDAKPHDTLLCVQTSALVDQKKRMRLSDESYYLKSMAEMEEIFRPLADLPKSAFTNTLKIAEMCEIDLEDKNYHLPDLPKDDDKHQIPTEIMPARFKETKDYDAFLRYLTEEGLKERYGDQANSKRVQERKEHELKIISQMGFSVYYIIVWDLCRFARNENIWWNVRGSGAGSIVAYATGITLIDPLRHNLIFERFLNPGRVSMPDFDLDYPDDQRKRMIEYTIERYGSHRVAQIVTFGRMKARAAIRDVGRALDIPLSEVDILAKHVSAIPGKPAKIDEVLDPEHEFYSPDLKSQYDNVDYVKELLDTARQLEGVARHASLHAAAVIITDKELTDYVPIMRAPSSSADESTYVTQFEFPVCESIGLLKVDFLGLSTLTVMRKASELIKKRHNVEFTLENLPMDNPEAFADLPDFPPSEKAFELLASGDVTGVFQVEGEGMRRVLRNMRPTQFEHIVAAISLFRPGPLEYIPTYIARMHGEEDVVYKHPSLEPILGETYGIIVYQEQIIRIASELAGYTPGEADLMRRAVSKKKKAELLRHRDKFITGAEERGIPAEVSEQIFADIEFFARYGFNKSHAADYALVTCQTAYLKAHYPVEYMAALLTVERNNSDKVGMLVSECQTMGIKVAPPNVNYSFIEFAIEEDEESAEKSAIRFGLSAIKNVGEGPIQAILDARAEEGPFTDLDEFCSRVDLRLVNRRGLEGLIKVGALDDFAPRDHLLTIIDRMINLSSSTHKAASVGQITMFDTTAFDAPQTGSILYPKPEDMKEISNKEILAWEKELVGVYLSDHPMEKHMASIKEDASLTFLSELGDLRPKQHVRTLGLITLVREHQTKKGKPMAFVEIEDTQVSREVVVFPRAWETHKELLEAGNLICVKGKVDLDGRQPKILADDFSKKLTSRGIKKESPSEEKRSHKSSTTRKAKKSTSSPKREKIPSTTPKPAPQPFLAEAAPSHSSVSTSTPTSSSSSSKVNGNGYPSSPNELPSPPKVAEKSPSDGTRSPSDSEPRLRIILPLLGRLVEDKNRLRRIVEQLAKEEGKDRFSICYRLDNGQKVEIDFPNHTTHYSPELEKTLRNIFKATVEHIR